MKFTPKLLLTALICTTGARLAYCSQAQSSSALATQAAPSARTQEQARLAQAAVQAAVAQLQRASTQGTTQATGQEIVERDAKRVKLSAAEEKQEAERQEKNWVLSYAQKLSHDSKKKLVADQMALIRKAIENERFDMLRQMLCNIIDKVLPATRTYDFPKELIDIIVDYAEPYDLDNKLDYEFKITIPELEEITTLTPLLVPHENILIMGLSNGYLKIFKETKDEQGKERWILLQEGKVHTNSITASVDLKNQRFATGSQDGIILIWEPKKNAQMHQCIAKIIVGMPIKKIAVLSDGNIVVGGTREDEEGDEEGAWEIWNPATQQKLYSRQLDHAPFIDLLVLSDDRIVINDNWSDLAIYEQTKANTSYTWSKKMTLHSPYFTQELQSLRLLPNDDIVRFDRLAGVNQIHISDHSTTNEHHLIFQSTTKYDDNESLTGALTILSTGAVKFACENNIKEFDILNKELTEFDHESARTKHLITLPDGRLLGTTSFIICTGGDHRKLTERCDKVKIWS